MDLRRELFEEIVILPGPIARVELDRLQAIDAQTQEIVVVDPVERSQAKERKKIVV